MKIYVIIFLLLVYKNSLLKAQDSALLKQRTFRVTAYSLDKIKTSSWLANITDSALQVTNMPVKFAKTGEPISITALNYNLLASVRIKRKNGALRGLGIGLLCGFAAGGIIGLLSGDDTDGFIRFSAGEKALAGGLLAGIFSAGIGAIVGALPGRKFIIGGRKANFDQLRLNVLDRVYRNNESVH